ncbi:MAG: iron ABC transporter permease [Buchananella hordeovulneris]|nr:iron ABC transporter permease [Buchananella hordeovulneris]
MGRALSGGLDAAWAALFRPRMWMLFTNTVWLVMSVCAGAFVLGVFSAWAVTRLRLPTPRLWVVLACLPLSVPSFVGAFAWRSAFPGTPGFWPLVAVMVAASTPFVTVPTMAAFVQADHGLADVARSLGRSRAFAFLTVTLPQVLPAAGAGTVIVALYTLADFGAPAMLRYDTLTTGVFALISAGASRSAPAVMGVVITFLAAVLVLGENLLRSRHHRATSSSYQSSLVRTSALVKWLAGGALAAIAALSVAAPIVALLVRSVLNTRYETDWARIFQAAGTTLLLGFVAATVAALVALPLSYISSRVRSPLVTLLEISTFASHALPGVVLALAMVSLTLQAAPWAYQTAGALIVTYVLLYLPKGVGAIRAGFQQVPVGVEETARTLGDSRLRVWWRVSLPQALPAIGAGWLLIATAVMKELPVTLMLRPTKLSTLATELWNSSSLGAFGAAAPVGLALVLVGIIPALMLARRIEIS